jgi:hypothetical protein
MTTCTHLDEARNVTPRASGCEECQEIGDDWVHLRLCLRVNRWFGIVPEHFYWSTGHFQRSTPVAQ